MAAPNATENWDRGLSLIGLAATCIAFALPFIGVPVPRWLGLLVLVTGCGIILWVLWQVSSRRHTAVRISVVSLVFAIYVLIGWGIYPGKVSSGAAPKESISVQSPQSTSGPAPISTQSGPAVLHECTVVFYNGASDPEFSIDGKPSPPARYSSGIATFRLANGTYLIRAEYPARSCSATVSIPSSGPLAATCTMK
jgi:hypothetical protein